MPNLTAALWKSLHQEHDLTSLMKLITSYVLNQKRLVNDNKNFGPSNFEDVEETDLMEDDPNIPLQCREDQGRMDPEFKGTIESLSRENKHTILEKEDEALIECTIQWLNMYTKSDRKRITERVVKQETK